MYIVHWNLYLLIDWIRLFSKLVRAPLILWMLISRKLWSVSCSVHTVELLCVHSIEPERILECGKDVWRGGFWGSLSLVKMHYLTWNSEWALDKTSCELWHHATDEDIAFKFFDRKADDGEGWWSDVEQVHGCGSVAGVVIWKILLCVPWMKHLQYPQVL